MKVVEIRDGFGLDHLSLAERPEPRVGPGQLLLQMKAVSLNYRDLLTVTGKYNPKQPLPLIPCSDGVGEVVEIGENVSQFRVGDRVCPIFAPDWREGGPQHAKLRTTLGGPLDGTLAEFMVVPEHAVVSVPEHLSDEEAATLPCAGVTAWNAVITHGEATPGQIVLTLGSGGVSIFALQFARGMGAEVIATSSSDEKLERLRQLGATATVHYRKIPEWGARVRELSGGAGVNLVVEVGGAGTLKESLRAVRIGGRIILIGVLSGTASALDVTPILMKQVRVQGMLVGSRDDFQQMNRAIAACRMRPVIDRVFALDGVRDAFAYLAEGKHFGKVCIRLVP